MTDNHISGDPLFACLGVSLESFAATWWETRPLYAPATSRPDDARSPVGLDDLDRLMSGAGRWPLVRIVRDGTDLAPDEYTHSRSVGNERLRDVIDPEAVSRNLDLGATVVLQGLQHHLPGVAALSGALGEMLGAKVHANVYCTPADKKGLAPHYDPHDVIVIQIDGSKRWVVHDPVVHLPGAHTAPVAVPSDLDPADGMDVVLHPGDALYLPRGFIHAPESLSRRSVHLTLGIQPVTWRDVLLEAVEEVLDGDEAFRRSALPTGDGRFAPGLDVAASRLAEVLGQHTKGSKTEQRWRRRMMFREDVRVLSREQLAADLGLQDAVRVRGGIEPTLESMPGEVTVTARGRVTRVPDELGDVVRELLSGKTRNAEDLARRAGGGDAERVLALVHHLVEQGVLVAASAAAVGAGARS